MSNVNGTGDVKGMGEAEDEKCLEWVTSVEQTTFLGWVTLMEWVTSCKG